MQIPVVVPVPAGCSSSTGTEVEARFDLASPHQAGLDHGQREGKKQERNEERKGMRKKRKKGGAAQRRVFGILVSNIIMQRYIIKNPFIYIVSCIHYIQDIHIYQKSHP